MSEDKARIQVKGGRLSFPNLFDPDSKYNKYSASVLIDPNSKTAEKIQKTIEAVAKDKWPKKYEKILKSIEMDKKMNCFLDGDLKDYDGYEGMMELRASSGTRPTVIGKDRSPVTKQDGVFYSGCGVNVIVRFWAQDNEYGKAIRAELCGVQFAGDNDAFGSGNAVADADEFDDLSDGADAADEFGSEDDKADDLIG